MSKYWAIFRIQAANRLAYPGHLVARSVSIVIFLFVFRFTIFPAALIGASPAELVASFPGNGWSSSFLAAWFF